MPKNQQDLREMVYHTDARVTAMEGQLASVASSQSRTESKLDQLINSLHQPKNVNYAAWVGVCLSLIAMLVGGTLTFTNYVKLTQDPIVIDADYNRHQINELREFQRQTHYEFGLLSQSKEIMEVEIERLWAHIHALEGIDREYRDRLAVQETSNKAIGDFLKDLARRFNDAKGG